MHHSISVHQPARKNQQKGAKNMDGNTELLNFVYQNSQMGVITIKQLLEIAEDADFRKQIQSQMEEYQKINSKAKEMLEENGCDEKGLGALEKVRTYLMIDVQTLMDKSTSHLAEMMLIGSTMGIVNSTRNLRKYKDAKKEILNLMDDLLKFEDGNFKQLRAFL